MTSQPLPLIDDVDQAASRLKLGVAASEFHGSLCGYLAGGGHASERNLIERLGYEASGTAASEPALHALLDASREALDSPDLHFMPLLPSEQEPLSDRIQALLDWTQGFLGGFGLAAGSQAPLSPESSEALNDLAKIAAFDALSDDDEEAQEAFEEILEFVRVAALLLHGDCRVAPAPRSRLH